MIVDIARRWEQTDLLDWIGEFRLPGIGKLAKSAAGEHNFGYALEAAKHIRVVKNYRNVRL